MTGHLATHLIIQDTWCLCGQKSIQLLLWPAYLPSTGINDELCAMLAHPFSLE